MSDEAMNDEVESKALLILAGKQLCLRCDTPIRRIGEFNDDFDQVCYQCWSEQNYDDEMRNAERAERDYAEREERAEYQRDAEAARARRR